MRIRLIVIFLFLPLLPVFSQTRSLQAIFPNLDPEIKNAAFSGEGYINASEKNSGFRLLGEGGALDPQIRNEVISKNPGIIAESLLVLPASSGTFSLLKVYNALGNIRGLKGRLYHSATRNEDIPLFEDATRLVSERKTTPVADPPPAGTLPRKETVFLRLKDVNFGNSYYRGDLSVDQHGLRYCLSNNKNITYILVPVIKEGKFIAQLYFEPIEEGMMIYSIAGADVSDFVASKIHMPSAISKRLAVIISWAAEGILK
jgi:hypothetical protein